MTARSVAFSKTVITELMIPSYANFGGKVHGGILMSLMDKTAYACASKHAGTYCVTVAVDNVEFLQPVDVGDLVYMHASINYVGNTSLVVGIKVIAENVKQGIVKHTNTSYFTMVAKDDDNQSVQVPALILEEEEDIRRFMEAAERRRARREFTESWQKMTRPFDVTKVIPLLKDQRCEIALAI